MPFRVREDRPWETAGEHKSYSQEMQDNFNEWMSEATGIPDWQEAGLYQDPGVQGRVPRAIRQEVGVANPTQTPVPLRREQFPLPPPPPSEVAGLPWREGMPEVVGTLPEHPDVYPGRSFARPDIKGSDLPVRMYNLNILKSSLAPNPNVIYPPPQFVNPDATPPMFLRQGFPTPEEEEEEREMLRRQMEAERQNEVQEWLQRGGWNQSSMR